MRLMPAWVSAVKRVNLIERVGGVRGLSLFAEYVGDPDATADAFHEHGFFRTGFHRASS